MKGQGKPHQNMVILLLNLLFHYSNNSLVSTFAGFKERKCRNILTNYINVPYHRKPCVTCYMSPKSNRFIKIMFFK